MSWGKFFFLLNKRAMEEEKTKLYLKKNFLCNVLWVFWGWFFSSSSLLFHPSGLPANTPHAEWLISEIFLTPSAQFLFASLNAKNEKENCLGQHAKLERELQSSSTLCFSLILCWRKFMTLKLSRVMMKMNIQKEFCVATTFQHFTT